MVVWPCASNCSRNRRYRESRRTVLSEIFRIVNYFPIERSNARAAQYFRGERFGTRRWIEAERGESGRHDGGGAARRRHHHIAQLLATPGEAGGDERAEGRDLFRRDERLRERRETHHGARNLGRRRERPGAYGEESLHTSHGLHADGQGAVRLGPRGRGDPVGDLGLDEKHDPRGEGWREGLVDQR